MLATERAFGRIAMLRVGVQRSRLMLCAETFPLQADRLDAHFAVRIASESQSDMIGDTQDTHGETRAPWQPLTSQRSRASAAPGDTAADDWIWETSGVLRKEEMFIHG